LFCEVDGKYYPNPGTYIRREASGPQDLYAHTTTSNLVVEAWFAGANTTYTCKYYIFVDPAQTYSGSGYSFTKDCGMKISKPGVDVKDAKSYELSHSSSFPSLKVYSSGQLTLELAERHCDASPNEASVTDTVSHSLGYAPYFLAFFKTTDSGIYINNNNDKFEVGSIIKGGLLGMIWILEGRCTSSELSFEFWRLSQCIDDPFEPGADCDWNCYNWGDETVTLYYYIFEENIEV